MKHTTLGTLHPADSVSTDGEKGTWYRASLQHRSAFGLKSGTTGWVTKTGIEPQVCMQSD
ncbi:hypothetical protein [Streptomyces sp. NPDC005262]|uniref:hypothetical protein n=1 Tax=Streptomyces sp. NPDC005262 TaxID=3364710 RepID=UPI0036D14398